MLGLAKGLFDALPPSYGTGRIFSQLRTSNTMIAVARVDYPPAGGNELTAPRVGMPREKRIDIGFAASLCPPSFRGRSPTVMCRPVAEEVCW